MQARNAYTSGAERTIHRKNAAFDQSPSTSTCSGRSYICPPEMEYSHPTFSNRMPAMRSTCSVIAIYAADSTLPVTRNVLLQAAAAAPAQEARDILRRHIPRNFERFTGQFPAASEQISRFFDLHAVFAEDRPQRLQRPLRQSSLHVKHRVRAKDANNRKQKAQRRAAFSAEQRTFRVGKPFRPA